MLVLVAPLAAAPLTAQAPPPVASAIVGTAHATMAEPADWKVERNPTHVRLTAPEGDFTVDLVWGVPMIHHVARWPDDHTDWIVLPGAGVGIVLLMNGKTGPDIHALAHACRRHARGGTSR